MIRKRLIFWIKRFDLPNITAVCVLIFLLVWLQTELLIEPRFPLFGGWKTFFTIGYGLPLSDFLFTSEGKRFLNISFGSPILDLVTEKLIVQVNIIHFQLSVFTSISLVFLCLRMMWNQIN